MLTLNEGRLSMLAACQRQVKTKPPAFIGVITHDLNDLPPQRVRMCQCLPVAEDIKSASRSGHGHADPVLDRKKSDLVFLAASDKRKYDHLVLFALVRVNSYHLHVLALEIAIIF